MTPRPLTLPAEIVAALAEGRTLTISLGPSQEPQEQVDVAAFLAMQQEQVDVAAFLAMQQDIATLIRHQKEIRQAIRQQEEALKPCGKDHGTWRCSYMVAHGRAGLCSADGCPHSPGKPT